MKCQQCNAENKDTAKVCKKCGTAFAKPVVLWRPDWKWHAKVLGVVYVVLLISFFVLNHALRPYMRQIPQDITPWLKAMPQASDDVVG